MKALALVLVVMALALLLIAGTVFGLGDQRVLVAPPEAVAEGFMRKLVMERYELARQHLGESLKVATSAARLNQATRHLMGQVGSIQDVRGEPGRIRGQAAEARVVLETPGTKEIAVRFQFTRAAGRMADQRAEKLGDRHPSLLSVGR